MRENSQHFHSSLIDHDLLEDPLVRKYTEK
jgi:hypothetical protein